MTKEQEMIDALSTENAELKKLLKETIKEFESLARTAHSYVYRLDDPISPKIAVGAALPYLRSQVRSAASYLGAIENEHPSLYPYEKW